MDINPHKEIPFEVLVSTMYRDDLSFLEKMFPGGDFSGFNILIINQTDKNRILHSPFANVRVVNAFIFGLSKSRNLALRHAKGEVCLIADDDVRFVPGFQHRITDAYNIYPQASVICFKTITTQGAPYSNYAGGTRALRPGNIKKILSVEVSFKPRDIRDKNIIFNEWFGLGAEFEDSETFFFLSDVIKSRLNAFFYPAFIVMHEAFSSSDDTGADRVIRARMAGFYRRYNKWAYFL
ncbi:MAG: glycosyltransferase family 2 protein, partial [Sinomicrobium sp.]|nr:glycosyltransferase family 2 protein [Sinomicrobium sp.]